METRYPDQETELDILSSEDSEDSELDVFLAFVCISPTICYKQPKNLLNPCILLYDLLFSSKT